MESVLESNRYESIEADVCVPIGWSSCWIRRDQIKIDLRLKWDETYYRWFFRQLASRFPLGVEMTASYSYERNGVCTIQCVKVEISTANSSPMVSFHYDRSGEELHLGGLTQNVPSNLSGLLPWQAIDDVVGGASEGRVATVNLLIDTRQLSSVLRTSLPGSGPFVVDFVHNSIFRVKLPQTISIVRGFVPVAARASQGGRKY